ncbi:MAG: methyltransferase domain-containing protein [Bradymonadaceae bacterium]
MTEEDPSLSEETLRETTDAIERLSKLSGGNRASRLGFERLIDRDMSQLSVLDVGTGNGAIPRQFARWGRQNGITMDIVGIDLLDSAIDQARRDSAGIEGLFFETVDLFDLDPGMRRFDVVHSSLVLHHFDDGEAARALDKMAALSKLGVIVNDLHRHPVHWLSSKVFVPLFTRNEISHHDGPVSILRAFTRRELVDLAQQADFSSFTLEWVFPFRWLLVGRR